MSPPAACTASVTADHDVLHHVHESPKVMLLPLVVLGFGAIFAGMIAAPLQVHSSFAP